MKEFREKVAVVTGAASGIGHALAERFAIDGMKVVLADIEEGSLTRTEREMREKGATVLGVLTDVSKAEEVEALAQKTLDAFGAVHILCNNAGVGGDMVASWEQTLENWEWVLGVNLWGVIHGIRTLFEQRNPTLDFIPDAISSDCASKTLRLSDGVRPSV